MGHKSQEIEAMLGFRGRDELIHRDDLVILQHDRPQDFRSQDAAPSLRVPVGIAEVKP